MILSPVLRLAFVIAATTAIAVSCSRVGDDRFPKLPDADQPDASDFIPDAGPGDAGPGDAAAPADGAPDAATAAP